MPKGVEHENPAEEPEPFHRVPTSVMPKGVEHMPTVEGRFGAIKGADLCDAERR